MAGYGVNVYSGIQLIRPLSCVSSVVYELSTSGSFSCPFQLIFNARPISWLYINLNYWHCGLTSRLLFFHPLTFLTTTKADATNVTVGYLEPRRQVIRWIITCLMIQIRVSKFKTMSLTFTVTLNCAIKGLSSLSTKTVYLLYITATCFG
jgi:hypothetical protein